MCIAVSIVEVVTDSECCWYRLLLLALVFFLWDRRCHMGKEFFECNKLLAAETRERHYQTHIGLSIERLIWQSRLNIFHMMFQEKSSSYQQDGRLSASVFSSPKSVSDEKSASNRVWISMANTKHKFPLYFFFSSIQCTYGPMHTHTHIRKHIIVTSYSHISHT